METNKRPSPQFILTQFAKATAEAAFNPPIEFDFSHLSDYRAMIALNALVNVARTTSFNSYPEIVIYSAEEIEAARLKSEFSKPIR